MSVSPRAGKKRAATRKAQGGELEELGSPAPRVAKSPRTPRAAPRSAARRNDNQASEVDSDTPSAMLGLVVRRRGRSKNEEQMDDPTWEAYEHRLTHLEQEKTALESKVSRVLDEARLRMEASLEELKDDLDNRLRFLSTNLDSLYEDTNVPRLTGGANTRQRKVFFPKESLLSRMLNYNDENYKTIFNIALCVLILWGLWLAYDDMDKSGLPNFDLLTWGIFRDLGPFVFNWFKMFTTSFSIIMVAHVAAESYGSHKNTFAVSVGVYVALQCIFFSFSWYIIYSRPKHFALPLGTYCIYMNVCIDVAKYGSRCLLRVSARCYVRTWVQTMNHLVRSTRILYVHSISITIPNG
jgi:hypothetical protein